MAGFPIKFHPFFIKSIQYYSTIVPQRPVLGHAASAGKGKEGCSNPVRNGEAMIAQLPIDQVTAFPDSNILLHFKPLAQIDWLAICKARRVRLVVCLQVINELDDKKADP